MAGYKSKIISLPIKETVAGPRVERLEAIGERLRGDGTRTLTVNCYKFIGRSSGGCLVPSWSHTERLPSELIVYTDDGHISARVELDAQSDFFIVSTADVNNGGDRPTERRALVSTDQLAVAVTAVLDNRIHVVS